MSDEKAEPFKRGKAEQSAGTMKKGLLLGAGFSYDLGMPLAVELTELFLGLFNPAAVHSLGSYYPSRSPSAKTGRSTRTQSRQAST